MGKGSPRVSITFSVHLMFHEKGFFIDRPSGMKDYLFLLYLTPVKSLVKGRELRIPVGSVIIYPPWEPMLYCGDGIGLGDHAFHCNGSAVKAILKRHSIPLLKPMLPEDSSLLAQVMSMINEEFHAPGRRSDEIQEAFLNLFCLELSRAGRCKSSASSPRLREVNAKIRSARSAMIAKPQDKWTLAGLSKMAGIGRSRFASMYKHLFGRSPIDELIDFRLKQARYLLSSGNCTVAEAARGSGFSSHQYFCRVFKSRYGSNPASQYGRNRNIGR